MVCYLKWELIVDGWKVATSFRQTGVLKQACTKKYRWFWLWCLHLFALDGINVLETFCRGASHFSEVLITRLPRKWMKRRKERANMWDEDDSAKSTKGAFFAHQVQLYCMYLLLHCTLLYWMTLLMVGQTKYSLTFHN